MCVSVCWCRVLFGGLSGGGGEQERTLKKAAIQPAAGRGRGAGAPPSPPLLCSLSPSNPPSPAPPESAARPAPRANRTRGDARDRSNLALDRAAGAGWPRGGAQARVRVSFLPTGWVRERGEPRGARLSRSLRSRQAPEGHTGSQRSTPEDEIRAFRTHLGDRLALLGTHDDGATRRAGLGTEGSTRLGGELGREHVCCCWGGGKR